MPADTPTAPLSPRELAALIRRVLGGYLGDAGVPAGGAGAGRLAASEEDAAVAARWLIETEQLGLPGFGVEIFVRELGRLRETAPRADTNAGSDSGTGSGTGTASDTASGTGSGTDSAMPDHRSASALDAAALPGHLALATATRAAREGAARHGLAGVAIHNAGAFGVLGCAARDIAAGGQVGLILADAPAAVAPWGGTRAAIGTNPIAVAVPRAGLPPLVLDFATAPLTLAALRAARASGDPLPAPGGFDAEGRPTADPAEASVIAAGDRIASLTGLAVAMLVGAGIGAGGPAGAVPGTRSALVIALSPEAFGNADAAGIGAALAATWSDAGGHSPARFDALPADPEAEPTPLTIPPERLDALASFLPRNDAGM